MLVHRAGREPQDLADVAVGLALGNPEQDFTFTVCEAEAFAQHLVFALTVGRGQTKEIFVRTDRAQQRECEGQPGGAGEGEVRFG